jgi:hypothetical protein
MKHKIVRLVAGIAAGNAETGGDASDFNGLAYMARLAFTDMVLWKKETKEIEMKIQIQIQMQREKSVSKKKRKRKKVRTK